MKPIHFFITALLLISCNQQAPKEKVEVARKDSTPSEREYDETSFDDFKTYYNHLVATFAKGDTAGINAAILSNTGLFIITGTNKNPKLDTILNAASFQKKYPELLKQLASIHSFLSQDTIPGFDCQHSFSNSYTSEEKNYRKISDYYELEAKTGKNILPRAVTFLQNLVARRLVNYDQHIELDFAWVETTWKLMVVDFYGLACPAKT